MATMSGRTRDQIVPSTRDSALAHEASRALAPHRDHVVHLRFHIGEDQHVSETLSLPVSAIRLLLDILT